MSRRHSAPGSLSNSARQQIDAIMATARNQIEAVLQREVERLMLQAQAQATADRRSDRWGQSHKPAAAPVQTTAPTRVYLRPVECNALFGIHISTLYRWAKAGKITIHKAGRMSLVKVSDMRALIEGNTP